jgi:O-antigen/teichoic acid export membrane protein
VQINHVSKYLVIFLFARAMLFLAPILLANLVPLEIYGKLEFAHAAGSMLALIASLGVGSLVPLVIIRRIHGVSWMAVLSLLYLVSLTLALFSLFAALLSLDVLSPFVLIPLSATVLLQQSFWSTYNKSIGRSETAVVLDAGFWVALLSGALAIKYFGLPASYIAAPPLLYLLGFALVMKGPLFLGANNPIGWKGVKVLAGKSCPILAATLLTVAVSTAGRLILGLTSATETVADYSVLYRVTALPIICHQIIITGLYSKIFSWKIDDLKKRLPLITLSVVGCIVVFWLAVDSFGWIFGERFQEVFRVYRVEGLILLSQTLLWSSIALNDLLNVRSQIAGTVTRWVGQYFFLLAILFSWLFLASSERATITLSVFIPAYAAIMLGYYLVQCCAMRANGLSMTRLWLLSGFCFALLCVCTLPF